jgi:ribosomal protein S6
MEETSHPEAPAEGLTQANDSKRPVYEVGFHVAPTIAETEVAAVVDKIRALLGDAEIIKEEFPHKLVLAYTIERATSGKREKYNEAYFGWIKFATEKQTIPAVQTALTAMREVIRFLLVETVREDAQAPRRTIFTSDRLEGETLQKPAAAPEKAVEVSEEELDKSIEALVS